MDPLTATIVAAVLIGIGYGLGYYRYGRSAPPVLFRIESDSGEWCGEMLLARKNDHLSVPNIVTMDVAEARRFGARFSKLVDDLAAGKFSEGSEEQRP